MAAVSIPGLVTPLPIKLDLESSRDGALRSKASALQNKSANDALFYWCTLKQGRMVHLNASGALEHKKQCTSKQILVHLNARNSAP